jgi:alpha/beta superfamily hydrolase
VSGKLHSVEFGGPAGRLEGLWKEAAGPRRGSAVFAHPHPLHGGTMHNKVVYRAAQALSAAGWETLRFNFRGVGASEGSYDEGRGEIEDFRAGAPPPMPVSWLPSLFVVGERDTFGPPALLRKFLAGSDAEIVAVRGADHFFEGKLPELEAAIFTFASSIRNSQFTIRNSRP